MVYCIFIILLLAVFAVAPKTWLSFFLIPVLIHVREFERKGRNDAKNTTIPPGFINKLDRRLCSGTLNDLKNRLVMKWVGEIPSHFVRNFFIRKFMV